MTLLVVLKVATVLIYNDISNGDISTCVVSDNTTSISDNRSDNSNDSSVASGNTNRIFVIVVKMLIVFQVAILPVVMVTIVISL